MGKRNAAICDTEFLITEMARSDCRLAASQTPTTFSTALPAMPTITRPVKAFEIPRVSTAESSEPTNQSDTNAAATPPAASSPIAKRNETWGRAGAAPSEGGSSERRYDHSQAPYTA